MLTLLAACLGLVQGSLFATIVLRVPAGRSVAAGRSRCDGCNRTLSWFELVPLLSWIALRGRCRSCGARIAPVHPLLELGSALAWVLALHLADGDVLQRLGWGFLAAASLALLYADFKDGLLPDWITGAIALGGLARAATLQTLNEQIAISLFAGLLLFGTRWAFLRLRGREALGMGDVKLFAALALWMQPHALGPALLCAALATLAAALLLRLQPQREIPFGPGLLFGAWIVFIFA